MTSDDVFSVAGLYLVLTKLNICTIDIRELNTLMIKVKYGE